MIAILQTIDLVLRLYMWVIILSAVLSWLFAFNVVNPRNQFVSTVGRILFQLTDPVLRPIRRYTTFGGLDLSPIVVLIVIFFLRSFLWTSIAPAIL